MPKTHIVKQGECLARIASQYRISDWRKIYNDPANAAFRAKRPNPDIIHPGDELTIPDIALRTEPGATESRHKFKVTRPKRILNIRLVATDGKALAGEDYRLVMPDLKDRTGRTDGKGKLSEELPVEIETAELHLKDRVWKLHLAHLNPAEDTIDDGVSGIQQRLTNMLYNPGPIDGIYGPRTEGAVRRFQQDHPPLKVDGICGPNTTKALKDAYGC